MDNGRIWIIFFNRYEYENTSTHTLPYILTTLDPAMLFLYFIGKHGAGSGYFDLS
jgi:hypothetical protein